MFEFPAKFIHENGNSSCGKPSDYSYISEFQEEFVLQKLHLQLHSLIGRESGVLYFGFFLGAPRETRQLSRKGSRCN